VKERAGREGKEVMGRECWDGKGKGRDWIGGA